MSPTKVKQKSGSPMFEIRSIPGKGQGLVACIDIAKGTRVIAETPLLVTYNMPDKILEPILATKLRALPKDKQRQYVSLHNNFPGKHVFSGILKTNALPCEADTSIGAVYATASRINHSCRSNCHYIYNAEQGHETIHTIRNIQAGEELTISYVKEGHSQGRQEDLKMASGFDCKCEVCALGEADLAASDKRREQMLHLNSEIAKTLTLSLDPMTGMANCHALLQLLQIEYRDAIGADLPRLYYDAFEICITHSDRARAAEFAKRAYHACIDFEGDDGQQTRRMKGLMKHPDSHESFGASQRWNTRVESTPRNLDAATFEIWLWARKEHKLWAYGHRPSIHK